MRARFSDPNKESSASFLPTKKRALLSSSRLPTKLGARRLSGMNQVKFLLESIQIKQMFVAVIVNVEACKNVCKFELSAVGPRKRLGGSRFRKKLFFSGIILVEYERAQQKINWKSR